MPQTKGKCPPIVERLNCAKQSYEGKLEVNKKKELHQHEKEAK